MRTRLRIAALSLALSLAIAAAACKPWPPSGPTEDGPPLPSTGTTATSSTQPTASAETPGRVATETTAAAPAKDPTDELKRTAGEAALKAARGASVPDIGTLNVGTVKLAKDADGTWWASVVVMPERTDVDGATAYLRFTGHGWTVIDFGTGIDPEDDERFPSEVGGKL